MVILIKGLAYFWTPITPSGGRLLHAALHRNALIPVPERRYWAKKAAGQKVTPQPLPPRFPGASEWVGIGGADWRYSQTDWDEIVSNPPPPAPVFDEPFEEVRARIIKMVGVVRPARDLTTCHPLVGKLVEQDEARRASRWDRPRYDDPLSQRRLRLMNSLFLALDRVGCKPTMSMSKYADEDREIGVSVGSQAVCLRIGSGAQSTGPTKSKRAEGLSVSIKIQGWGSTENRHYWRDEEKRVEEFLTQIVVEILLSGEFQMRELAEHNHTWLLKRRLEEIEDARKRDIERVRKAREQQERDERQRVERLLADAQALERADKIRKYVAEIRCRSAEIAAPGEAIELWAEWALDQADRIDPIKTLSFLNQLPVDQV